MPAPWPGDVWQIFSVLVDFIWGELENKQTNAWLASVCLFVCFLIETMNATKEKYRMPWPHLMSTQTSLGDHCGI